MGAGMIQFFWVGEVEEPVKIITEINLAIEDETIELTIEDETIELTIKE